MSKIYWLLKNVFGNFNKFKKKKKNIKEKFRVLMIIFGVF